MALPHVGEWQLVTAARLGVDSEPAQEVRHAPGALVNQFSGQRVGESLNVAFGQFLWCKYSHHGPFQAPMETSLNALSSELGRQAQSALPIHLVPLPTSPHPQPHCHAFHGAEMLKSQPSLLTKASAG